jgi:hypothetical protein
VSVPIGVGVAAVAHRASGAPARSLRFAGGNFSFQYPAAWEASRYQEDGSFSSLIVDLSTLRMHPPCVTRHGKFNTTITCREPIDHLKAGSVLASWSTQSWQGWTFGHVQGTPLRVGGRPAKLDVTHDSCGIGADEMMQVVIAIPGRAEANSWYQLDACIRGPGASTMERIVRQLLRTVRFRG